MVCIVEALAWVSLLINVIVYHLHIFQYGILCEFSYNLLDSWWKRIWTFRSKTKMAWTTRSTRPCGKSYSYFYSLPFVDYRFLWCLTTSRHGIQAFMFLKPFPDLKLLLQLVSEWMEGRNFSHCSCFVFILQQRYGRRIGSKELSPISGSKVIFHLDLWPVMTFHFKFREIFLGQILAQFCFIWTVIILNSLHV